MSNELLIGIIAGTVIGGITVFAAHRLFAGGGKDDQRRRLRERSGQSRDGRTRAFREDMVRSDPSRSGQATAAATVPPTTSTQSFPPDFMDANDVERAVEALGSDAGIDHSTARTIMDRLGVKIEGSVTTSGFSVKCSTIKRDNSKPMTKVSIDIQGRGHYGLPADVISLVQQGRIEEASRIVATEAGVDPALARNMLDSVSVAIKGG